MPQFHFDVLLRQPVIVSQHSATTGAHECLDYLPGSVFLGLAASRLYQTLPPDESWRLFHSGQVRFGDALPLAYGETAWPVPLNWHHHKGESPRVDDCLLQDRLYDPSRKEPDAARQPAQLRGGYVTESGNSVMPERSFCMKTAIDRHTGLVAASQLFGYQALQPGLSYRFSLDLDEDLPAALISTLTNVLPGKARLGRSRSAEFGAVQITSVDDAAMPVVGQPEDPLTLTLWLLSDLQLLNRGQPALQPLAELLGLPAGSEWLSKASFLRGRRYSPWNAWRRHHECERQVISRGSVLRYRLPAPLDSQALANLNQGVGLHIEAGLGRVWVNPPLLAGEKPRFSAPKATPVASNRGQLSTPPPSALIRRLQERARQHAGAQAWQWHAEQLFIGLTDRIYEARSWQAIPGDEPLPNTPGRSQWGRLKTLATDCRGRDAELLDNLTHTTHGVLRERSGWELKFGPDGGNSLGNWLGSELHKLAEQGKPLDRILGHLAVLGLQPRWSKVCEGRLEEQA